MGLPISPYFDRNNTDQLKLSMNFVDFICLPMHVAMAKQLPGMSCCVDYIKANRSEWARLKSIEPLLPKKEEDPVSIIPTTTTKKVLEGRDLDFYPSRNNNNSVSAPTTITTNITILNNNSIIEKRKELFKATRQSSKFLYEDDL